MLRDAKSVMKAAKPQGPAHKQPRFKITRLEERVAPKGNVNPHGKQVGGSGNGNLLK